MKTSARQMALGGILAALAVTVMAMGGLIPVATYVCPMIDMLILSLVLKFCGARTAWAWYGTVAILSLLLGPDKEAAAVFAFLGYYPILKPRLDLKKLGWLYKGLLFNSVILAMYWLLINLFGMAQIAGEFEELGQVMLAVLLVLGNVTFYLLDVILTRVSMLKQRKGRA